MAKTCCLGRRIGCDVARSIKHEPGFWKVSALPTQELSGAQLTNGKYRVVLMPNPRCPCQPMFDIVRLSYEGVPVHVPLLARRCLRKRARQRVQLAVSRNERL